MPTGEWDFTRYRTYEEDLRVSEDGFFTCVPCSTVVEATGETVVTEDDRKRGVWKCPDCEATYYE